VVDTFVATESVAPDQTGYIGRIPVRNLWLLMFYASDLFSQLGNDRHAVEDAPEEIPDLIAEILIHAVDQRIRRNLGFGYQTREAVLGCVRGRIDLLQTERRQLLERGRVACRFDELTVDTPRNRFVRAALEEVANVVKRPKLTRECRALASTLRQMGVTGQTLERNAVSVDRFGRHDVDDQRMVTAAQLAFDLALPTEEGGMRHLPVPDREITWVRKLYEKAVAEFYKVVLRPPKWRVRAQHSLTWPIEGKTPGIDHILPGMRTDVEIDDVESHRRIVIDTKFTSIVTRGWYREDAIRSGYLYQIYAYLRSQEGNGDPYADTASGLLLHPAIGDSVDESVVMQGHEIRFATVNLAASALEIRRQLLRVVKANLVYLESGGEVETCIG